MKYKYSVVIPVYNAEATLRRCLDSLVDQINSVGRKDVQIILVNDGSKDKSLEICLAYAQKNPFITCIDQANGGVSKARNRGIEEASGQYLTFVDSDDYVAENYFSVIEWNMIDGDWDMLQFSRACFHGRRVKKYPDKDKCFYDQKACIGFLQEAMCTKMINYPVTKVYKTKIVKENRLQFPENISIGEDKVFNILYVLRAKKIKSISKVLYYVSLENPESLSRKKLSDQEKQFTLLGQAIHQAIRTSDLTPALKKEVHKAEDFLACRNVYRIAKELHWNRVGWLERIFRLHRECKKINQMKYTYPRIRFCRLVTLPVRFHMAICLDLLAWKLTH